jgi:hypothetical protein
MGRHKPPVKTKGTKKMKIKIGTNKGKPRICLWSSKMIDAGFAIGQPIKITQINKFDHETNDGRIWFVFIKPVKESTRKVSGVTNHGKKIPVIDLKTTQALDISKLGNAGDFVEVTYNKNLITIKSNTQPNSKLPKTASDNFATPMKINRNTIWGI